MKQRLPLDYAQVSMTRLVRYILKGDTGVSSETIIAAALKTRRRDFRGDAPYDPADFGRCYRLLQRFPWLRPLAFPILDRRPEWRELVRNWDELVKVYLRDLPTGRSTDLYEMIGALRGDRT